MVFQHPISEKVGIEPTAIHGVDGPNLIEPAAFGCRMMCAVVLGAFGSGRRTGDAVQKDTGLRRAFSSREGWMDGWEASHDSEAGPQRPSAPEDPG
jgi:hypothetical protein